MEWIRVNERLPEKDATVLVALGECVTIADWYVKDGWILDRELTALFPTRTVTHWMPLPEPPTPITDSLLDWNYIAECAAEADPAITLEAVREGLSKIPGSMTEDFRKER